MSGTSLDGLDLAYCHFWKEKEQWNFEIKKALTVPYDSEWIDRLQNSIEYSAGDLLELHSEYGIFLGEKARSFIEKEGIAVDYIASHGHTVHHQPELGFTLQLGSGQHLATASSCTTICDFRTKDVALGGQGAPLVPIGDQIFFDRFQFCLNLGGISNVSFEAEGKRIAYDIGIANMLLNYLSQKKGVAYDDRGALARSGSLDTQLLEELNRLDYYALPYPKSTGYEWFKSDILPIIQERSVDVQSLLKTSVHHIAEQVSRQLQLHAKMESSDVLVTGGGAFNDYLIEILQSKLGASFTIVVPEKKLVAFKEALVFAFMGLLRIQDETNILCSVTGARRDSCSGVIYLP